MPPHTASKLTLDPDSHPTPDPEELYPSRLRALMPQPHGAGGKAPWPSNSPARQSRPWTCWPPGLSAPPDQLAGLMGGVTRRRANQVLRALTEHWH